MNLKELNQAIYQLVVNIRSELNQVDGSVYTNDAEFNPGVVKFSVVREGKVKVFTIQTWEESL